MGKFIFYMFLIFGVSFMSYGFGRVNKKQQIFNNCLQYYSGLPAEEAKEACTDMIKGDRHVVREYHD